MNMPTCDDEYGIVGLMSIYECTMVDSEREPTPDVRCTNVEQHTMDEDFSIVSTCHFCSNGKAI